MLSRLPRKLARSCLEESFRPKKSHVYHSRPKGEGPEFSQSAVPILLTALIDYAIFDRR